MIEKKEKKGDVTVYYVKKDYENSKLLKILNKKLKRTDIHTIIKDDADVYNEEGKLLLRFRKNKLNKDTVKDFYDNVIKFAKQQTTTRGTSSGSKKKIVGQNPKVMSNIIGYFDKLSPRQKWLFNQQGKPIPKVTVRETAFLQEHPEQFKKAIPLIKEIDKYYEQYVPENYGKQKKKANQTPFKIPNTAFTTITTNVNFRTTIHKDKGDDVEGFGNLAVIEKGKYTGGETCLPQYGIGVDVRNNDILYMDVHEWHGNLPIKLIDKNATRLSIVCYLRYNIWEKTKHKTKKFMIKHNKTIKNLRKHK